MSMAAELPVNPMASWQRYLMAISLLLAFISRRVGSEPGAAFASWERGVLDLLSGEAGSAAIGNALRLMLEREDTRPVTRLMLQELEAFVLYVGRLTGMAVPDLPTREWPPLELPHIDPKHVGEGLDIAKTITESLRELIDKLPFPWKAGLKALEELIDIGKAFLPR